MPQPYRVALVVDPAFGAALRDLAREMHVWAVGTPENRAVAEAIWAERPNERDIERGVTTFDPGLGSGPRSWCSAVVGTVDAHHDEMSHDPAYSELLVHGLRFDETLRPDFAALGFTRFIETPYGFLAVKSGL